MHETQQTGPEQHTQLAKSPRPTPTSPSSSRMIASYLTDIEQLLDEQRFDAALREASDLPRIAVALADPQLRSSGEEVRNWCQEWVRPPELTERVVPQNGPESVPTRALRRLQLRRHARTAPRGFSTERGEHLAPQETATAKMGVALLDAARRWYARSGVHDPTVQDNLARLAVLR
jgi:hypothetical protein